LDALLRVLFPEHTLLVVLALLVFLFTPLDAHAEVVAELIPSRVLALIAVPGLLFSPMSLKRYLRKLKPWMVWHHPTKPTM
jgi:hypothetical protein